MPYNILIPYCIAFGCLIAAAAFDIKTRRIPNALTFPMILCGLFITICLRPNMLFMSIVGVIVSFFFSFIPGIGMGDIKLIMGLCFYINPIHVMLSLALASILVFIKYFIKYPWNMGTLITMLYPSSPEKKSVGNSVVFAPYLLLSTAITEGVFYLWPIFLSL